MMKKILLILVFVVVESFSQSAFAECINWYKYRWTGSWTLGEYPLYLTDARDLVCSNILASQSAPGGDWENCISVSCDIADSTTVRKSYYVSGVDYNNGTVSSTADIKSVNQCDYKLNGESSLLITTADLGTYFTARTCTIDPTIFAAKMQGACSCGSGAPCPQTSNPINFAIGNKFFIETDYRRRGAFPIVFRRTYNSLDRGWRFSYMQFIEVLSVDRVAVHRPDGKVLEFALLNGSWTPDSDVVARLEGSPENGWTYHRADNVQELYDGNGRLAVVENSSGSQQTLSYDDANNIFTVTDPAGSWIKVQLSVPDGQPLQLSDNSGETITYQYDSDQQLEQVTNVDGSTKQYLHEVAGSPWLITGIVDENGSRSHTVAYDVQGRAIMSELANGAERVDVTYNDDDSVTLTNALGKQTRFEFQPVQGVRHIVHIDGEPTTTCQGTVKDYTYDANGFLIEKVDAAGVITRYTRNLRGLELSRTEAYGTPLVRTITTVWDSERRLPLKITEPERVTTYHYDDKGRLVSTTVESLQ